MINDKKELRITNDEERGGGCKIYRGVCKTPLYKTIQKQLITMIIGFSKVCDLQYYNYSEILISTTSGSTEAPAPPW